MNDAYNVECVAVGELMPRSALLKTDLWRLCQIHSVRVSSGYEVTYSFAKDYELKHFKLCVSEEEAVPSITPIFACAWMYENEIAELFGVNIENIQMSYEKKLYKLNVETPFK